MILVFSACKEEEIVLQIEEDNLINIVADLQIADEALKKSAGSEKDSLAQVYKKQICSIHGVDVKILESDLLILKNDPQRYEKFFEKVIVRLEKLEDMGDDNN